MSAVLECPAVTIDNSDVTDVTHIKYEGVVTVTCDDGYLAEEDQTKQFQIVCADDFTFKNMQRCKGMHKAHGEFRHKNLQIYFNYSA